MNTVYLLVRSRDDYNYSSHTLGPYSTPEKANQVRSSLRGTWRIEPRKMDSGVALSANTNLYLVEIYFPNEVSRIEKDCFPKYEYMSSSITTTYHHNSHDTTSSKVICHLWSESESEAAKMAKSEAKKIFDSVFGD